MRLHGRFGGWRDWLAPTLAAIGLAGIVALFAREQRAFRAAVTGWARHDLEERTALAAATLTEPLAGGDYARLAEFGAACAQDGVRLTVVAGGSGAVLYDSHPGDAAEASIYAERLSGECVVRLGLPLARVLAPFRRSRGGLLLAALFGAAGVLLVFFVTYRQRVRIRELRRLEKFRRDFIADLSHEIKTPLAGIVGAADMLGTGGDDAQLVQIVRASAGRLDRLAREVLSLARLERGGGGLDRRRVALGALVAEVASAYPQCRVETDRAVVRCDRDRVAEALENLIVNALRHSGSDEVRVWQHGATIAVEDCGRGVAPEERERIFERFHRSSSARAGAAEGSGLGLAIVRQIARLHGGDAWCEGVRPHGSRFVLKLG